MKKITLITILMTGALNFSQNLIVNGGFEDGIETGWLNAASGDDNSFNSAAVSAGAAFNTFSISSLEVVEGNKAGQLKTGGSAIRQVVTVTPGTYIVQFWFAGSKPNFVVPAIITDWTTNAAGANLVLTPLVADSGANTGDNTQYGCQSSSIDDGSLSSWKEAKFSFQVDETVTKVRFTYFLSTGNEIQFLDKVSIILDNKASVDDNSKLNFSVYPNPAKDILYFKSLNTIVGADIYDITGKQVFKSKKIYNNSIDVSKLKSGIYVLRLKDIDENLSTKKLIISR